MNVTFLESEQFFFPIEFTQYVLQEETNSNKSEEHIWFEINMGEGTTTIDDETGTEISFPA